MSDAAQQIAEFCADVERRHGMSQLFSSIVCSYCSDPRGGRQIYAPCDAIRAVRALRAMLGVYNAGRWIRHDFTDAVAAALRED